MFMLSASWLLGVAVRFRCESLPRTRAFSRPQDNTGLYSRILKWVKMAFRKVMLEDWFTFLSSLPCE